MKEYKPMICIDTCILNNLLGLDDEKNPKISEQYDKKKLTRYIQHHGYELTPVNLYERLIKDDWNDKKIVQNLKKLNAKTYQIMHKQNLKLYERMHLIPTEDERDVFLRTLSHKIIKFASDFYSRLTVYSYAYLLQSLCFSLQSQNIDFSIEYLSNHLERVVKFIKGIIKEQLEKLGLFRKSNAEKVLNKIFLAINFISSNWYNNEVVKQMDQSNFSIEEFVDTFMKLVENHNFDDEIKKANNSKTAKVDDSMVYSLFEATFDYASKYNNISQDIWQSKFSDLNNKLLSVQFNWKDENNITDVYFKNNLNQMYFNYFKDNANKKVKRAVDVNDIIDLMSLEYVKDKDYIYITTDADINRVLNKLYNNKQKEFLNAFINFKFDKLQ